jgi:hypothetical protein
VDVAALLDPARAHDAERRQRHHVRVEMPAVSVKRTSLMPPFKATEAAVL